jgi:hypothetical protein
MLNVIMQSLLRLSVILLSVVLLSVALLSFIMLSVIKLSVITLTVVAPLKGQVCVVYKLDNELLEQTIELATRQPGKHQV